MKTRVQKWGNSLGVRIPKAFAEEAQLVDGTPVEIKLVEGHLVMIPISEIPTLEELLAEITDDNVHGEFETGPPVGRESW